MSAAAEKDAVSGRAGNQFGGTERHDARVDFFPEDFLVPDVPTLLKYFLPFCFRQVLMAIVFVQSRWCRCLGSHCAVLSRRHPRSKDDPLGTTTIQLCPRSQRRSGPMISTCSHRPCVPVFAMYVDANARKNAKDPFGYYSPDLVFSYICNENTETDPRPQPRTQNPLHFTLSSFIHRPSMHVIGLRIFSPVCPPRTF